MTEELNLTEETFNDMDDALTLDDLSTGYIANPAVGAGPTEFVIKKITKLTGTRLIGKAKDGTTFKKNLSNVEYGYEVVTDNGSKYTISSWEVFGKMKSIFAKLHEEKRKHTIEGVKIQITHLLDGMEPENKKKDKYKVAAEVDGVFKTLDRDTQEWSN